MYIIYIIYIYKYDIDFEVNPLQFTILLLVCKKQCKECKLFFR